ncbi:uncharacterized protein C16orf46 homolog [Ctenodactylus gundi]
MAQCQESEADVDSNESQGTKETELTCTCPDGSSEKNYVYCLLHISDLTLEEDRGAKESVIGTGWEEAVRGWGKTSPTACIWPQKKLKKARVGESASSNCLLCVSLSQGSLDPGPAAEAVAQEGLEKSQPSSSQTLASREESKGRFPSYTSDGGKKSLQIREYIWCLEKWANSESASDQDSTSPSGGVQGSGQSISDSLTSRALLALPPLKASPLNGSEDLGKKSKKCLWQAEEKPLGVEKEERVACLYGLKTVDWKGERRPFDFTKHLKVSDRAPFPPRAAETSRLAVKKPSCLQWPLHPEGSSICTPSSNLMPYLTTWQLLHDQRMHSCKAKVKDSGPRPPRCSQKHFLPEEAVQPQELGTKVFPKPLLPSLTVSRMVIPISTHRFL